VRSDEWPAWFSFLVFWALAGACQRHGVGGFLLCNTTTTQLIIIIIRSSPRNPEVLAPPRLEKRVPARLLRWRGFGSSALRSHPPQRGRRCWFPAPRRGWRRAPRPDAAGRRLLGARGGRCRPAAREPLALACLALALLGALLALARALGARTLALHARHTLLDAERVDIDWLQEIGSERRAARDRLERGLRGQNGAVRRRVASSRLRVGVVAFGVVVFGVIVGAFVGAFSGRTGGARPVIVVLLLLRRRLACGRWMPREIWRRARCDAMTILDNDEVPSRSW